jgi:hypothetical protein
MWLLLNANKIALAEMATFKQCEAAAQAIAAWVPDVTLYCTSAI